MKHELFYSTKKICNNFVSCFFYGYHNVETAPAETVTFYVSCTGCFFCVKMVEM